MISIAVLKQDFLINKKTILLSYAFQLLSLLLAAVIRNMRLIEISDIFWDTLPTVVIPMIMQMILVYEAVCKREADKTMAFVLSTLHTPEQVILTKAVFLIANMFLLCSFSMVFGCLTHVYDLTGVWNANSYIILHIGSMGLQLFVGGWCFLISCTGKKTRTFFYMKAAVGVLTLLYGMYLLYYLYPRQLFFLQYITVFSLFRQALFATSPMLALTESVILAALGVGCYVLGRNAFCRRGVQV